MTYYLYQSAGILCPLLIIIFALVLLISFFIDVWKPFKEQRDYIKLEMHRANSDEYEHWRKELKLFYISYIPIVRFFYRKEYK